MIAERERQAGRSAIAWLSTSCGRGPPTVHRERRVDGSDVLHELLARGRVRLDRRHHREPRACRPMRTGRERRSAGTLLAVLVQAGDRVDPGDAVDRGQRALRSRRCGLAGRAPADDASGATTGSAPASARAEVARGARR